MRYRRMPIEVESPEELGYGTIANNLAESSFSDLRLADATASTATSRTCCCSTATTRACPSCAS